MREERVKFVEAICPQCGDSLGLFPDDQKMYCLKCQDNFRMIDLIDYDKKE